MIEIINQRIDAAESMASRLKKSAREAALRIATSDKMYNEAPTRIPVREKAEGCGSRHSGNALRYLSLAALVIGGIGWAASSALWSKLLAISGSAVFAYSFIRKDSSNGNFQSAHRGAQPAEVELSARFVAEESSVLIDELRNASDVWAAFAESSNSMLDSKLEDLHSISSQERFNLKSLIRVPKTLSFPLIEYRNILENATTPEELKKASNEVVELASAEIDKVVLSQVANYKKMRELIGTIGG